VLIAGSLSEYPLALLLEIFLLRRETGLLEISSGGDSGYFYLKNGKVKDAQIGKSKGVAAIHVVRKLNDGSFRFKPVEPAEYARVVWQKWFGPTAPAIGQVTIPVPAIKKRIGELNFDPAASRRMLTELNASTERALRQLIVYTSFGYRDVQRIEARIEIRIRRMLETAFAAYDQRRRNRQHKPRHPLKVSFQLPTLPRAAAITAALQQGVEHNVIFAFTLTILVAISGVMLYQLVFVDPNSTNTGATGFTIDEHFDISPSTSRPPTKTKRERRKERTVNSSRDKSPNKTPAVESTQDPVAVPETSPPGAVS
jgi:hypothetical protein